ncbi:helix-turn-helix domain-containing protein [Aquibacillus kalidii]|uniref:helix-turn-helix domain-containing protein n=1 Tax=Aquibacillus kalidii TaxID=2762597 RepID=UPI00164723F2|nr:helix-turn-helix transcriptional regulator [Aquibacillus kalidii]
MVYKITSVEYNILKNSSLGERIRLIRKKLMDEVDHEFYTTKSISNRTGIASQTITSIERGESRKPSFNVIHALSKEFHVEMQVFTDEFYQADEFLFSVGPQNDVIDISDIDLDEVESLVIGEREYFIKDMDNGEKTWNHRRRVSFIVHEDMSDNEKKVLYHFDKPMTEIELTRVLSQLIQSVELSPESLSSSEWNEAIKRSPLSEAHQIISRPYSGLPGTE